MDTRADVSLQIRNIDNWHRYFVAGQFVGSDTNRSYPVEFYTRGPIGPVLTTGERYVVVMYESTGETISEGHILALWKNRIGTLSPFYTQKGMTAFTAEVRVTPVKPGKKAKRITGRFVNLQDGSQTRFKFDPARSPGNCITNGGRYLVVFRPRWFGAVREDEMTGVIQRRMETQQPIKTP